MDGQSLNIKQDILNQLKSIIPNCFTEDKIDWEKIKVFLEDNIEFLNERYNLNWAGKTDAFRLLQAPTYQTLKPCREESVNFDETENLFIEGDNLEVLKTLQKAYFGKIKMIYIDPPYNTGNDFIYKDNFTESLTEYRKKVGDVDENGNITRVALFKNTRENGQYHSNWLNMMYPRLFLARNLLRDDGVIFVSIDDNEVHNLRLIMDEIFGEENFVAQVIWERAFAPVNLKKHFSQSHDYILIYAKNLSQIDRFTLPRTSVTDNRYKNPDNDPRGPWQSGDFSVGPAVPENIYEIITPTGKKVLPPNGRSWCVSKQKFEEMLTNNEIWFGHDGNGVPRQKRFLLNVKQGVVPMTLWKYKEVDHSQEATKQLKELFNNLHIYDYPKPVKLIKRCLSITTKSSDLILDFFAGSGTTAHAVMALNKEDGGNRKFILVQLPEPTEPESEAYIAGYKTIADIAKERIRRAAKKIQQELNEEKKKSGEKLQFEPAKEKKLDLGFKVFKLEESNFKQWRPFVPEKPEDIQLAIQEHTENIKPEATTENILYELMLKNGKKLTDKIEKKDEYYIINDTELVLLLESVDESIRDEVLKLKPQKIIALDKLFNNNDQLKTNIVLQFKNAGIEFKSV